MKYIRMFLIGVLIFICVGGIIQIESHKNQLTIYSGMENFRNDALKKQLKGKFPDIDITIQRMSANKGAAKLKLEKTRTDADIIVGFDIQSLELVKDLFENLDEYSDAQYLPNLNPKHGKYKIWEKFSGAFILNLDLLEKMGLSEPHTYEDLLKTEYNNLIAMPNPKFSGTGYLFFKSLVNELGEEEALAYIDKLYPNIKQFTESGSGPVKLLLQNEVAIGLGMTFQAVGEINKGQNLKITYPPQGAPYSLMGIAIVKGRKHDKNVRKVFEFLYNEFIYYDKTYYSPECIFKNQKVNMKHYPCHIIYANMQGIESPEEKQRLLRKWKY